MIESGEAPRKTALIQLCFLTKVTRPSAAASAPTVSGHALDSLTGANNGAQQHPVCAVSRHTCLLLHVAHTGITPMLARVLASPQVPSASITTADPSMMPLEAATIGSLGVACGASRRCLSLLPLRKRLCYATHDMTSPPAGAQGRGGDQRRLSEADARLRHRVRRACGPGRHGQRPPGARPCTALEPRRCSAVSDPKQTADIVCHQGAGRQRLARSGTTAVVKAQTEVRGQCV